MENSMNNKPWGVIMGTWDGFWHDRTLVVKGWKGDEIERLTTDLRWGHGVSERGSIHFFEARYQDMWVPVRKRVDGIFQYWSGESEEVRRIFTQLCRTWPPIECTVCQDRDYEWQQAHPDVDPDGFPDHPLYLVDWDFDELNYEGTFEMVCPDCGTEYETELIHWSVKKEEHGEE